MFVAYKLKLKGRLRSTISNHKLTHHSLGQSSMQRDSYAFKYPSVLMYNTRQLKSAINIIWFVFRGYINQLFQLKICNLVKNQARAAKSEPA